MTFRQFARAAFLFPATVLGGITDLLLGSYKRKATGEIRTDADGNALTRPGLLSSILDGIKYVARGVANFVYNHRQAIATAAWASLLVAGAAALTVFLWPAALAFATTFSIAGYSIASVVGANVVAQIAAVGVVGAVATSAAVYTVAAIANTISAISSFFASRSRAQQPANEPTIGGQEVTATKSAKELSKLGKPIPVTQAELKDEAQPVHRTVLKSSAELKKDSKVEAESSVEEVVVGATIAKV
ncbi:hypothetical protein [Legionella maioricensis]|uniref:Transmembrane protein n=1 Tax=Legionella maioricensis TaxID=2896528 RepID=A0A9X2I9U5_9GAMM|nr:hypothetical protein [Legionella maioricensis]MCL9682986.1 hypothetical protein [Legionella maioricensis]MCL9686334.1 hypothetical protein [Legionella maioricensis]